METSVSIFTASGLARNSLYSLEKLIEWKLDGSEIMLTNKLRLSLLAREIN